MPEKVKDLKPPTGLARLAFRAPLWLYRAGLGWLLGGRFLELTHIGRKSGKERQTVLEVVKHDRQTGAYYVAAGFGPKSDWYQNVLANPQVKVRSGRQSMAARAVPLAAEESGLVLVDYAHRYPLAFKELCQFMGYRVDGSDADIRALGQDLHLVALRPTA